MRQRKNYLGGSSMADKKHLIPVIRKTIPSDLAKSIVGVQPMTGNTGEIFNLGSPDGEKVLYPLGEGILSGLF